MPRETISSGAIARPVGPFAPAVRAGEFIWLSGQAAQSPTTGKSTPIDQVMNDEPAQLTQETP
jgi:enamine deaminase RidA (YjgF/YER057c/UK114 family)